MFKISAETWIRNDIIIRICKSEENKLEIWLKMRDIQDKLGVKNMSYLAIKKIEGIYNKNTYNKLAIEVAERNYCDRN